MAFPSCNATDHHKIRNYIDAIDNAQHAYHKGFMNYEYDTHITDIFDNYFNNPDNLTTMTFNEREKMFYQYNPKQLCIDLYGTHDFWQIILQLNDYDAIGEFDLSKPIIVPTSDTFEAYIERVYDYRRNDMHDIFNMNR